MILIIKSKNSNLLKILKLSQFGHASNCKIFDLGLEECIAETVFKDRKRKFYRMLIDDLISKNYSIKPWRDSEVTNTLHDRLIKFFADNLKVNVFEFTLDDSRIEQWFMT